jgi:hypothetical protein
MKKLILALGLLGLCSCHQITDYPQQPALITPCTLTEATIKVNWVKDVDEIMKACHGTHTLYGCAEPEWTGGSTVVWKLTVVQPKDFNDVPVLAFLGHEVCHALGGVHATN